MTRDDDSPARLAADLATYLSQLQDHGVEWILDAGEPADLPAPAAVTAPEPVAAPAAVPAPAPAVAERAAERARREAEFAERCAAFVQATLETIAVHRPEPAASDLFTAPAAPVAEPDAAAKARLLAEMADEVAGCTACKLHGGRNLTVFGAGDADADLVFVGEGPGREEDRQGVPFVGPAGKLLDDILGAIRFARESIYICNILKCRPPNNRDPERDEVDACEPFLKRQLEIIRPRLICCLGRHAAMTLLQTRASLRSMRESIHFYQGVPVLVTYHPAALLRNPGWKRDTWDDVRRLRALYDALLSDGGGA